MSTAGRARVASFAITIVTACGGGAGSGTAVNNVTTVGNPAPAVRAEFTLQDIEASPYAVWADELGSREITIKARTRTAGGVGLELSYFDGLVGGTGELVNRPMFDDGTHGDTKAGDDVWTLSFVIDVAEPSRLRLYDALVDRVPIAISAVDRDGDRVVTTNSIDASVDIAILSRALEAEFAPRTVAADLLVTETMVNILDAGFDGSSLARVTERLYRAFADDPFDFVVIFHTRTSGDGIPRSVAVRNDVDGINLARFDHSAAYGSAGRLQQVAFQNSHMAGLEINHELGHRWGAYLNAQALNLSLPTGFHWGASNHVGQMGNGPSLLERSDGSLLVTNAEGSENFIGNPFSLLELYLMGLVPAAQVTPLRFVTDPSVAVAFGALLPESGTQVVTIEDIVAAYGERAPAAATSQNEFTAAFVVVSDHFLDPAEYTLTSAVARYLGGISVGGPRSGGLFDVLDPPSFSGATGFRATLETQLPSL